MTSTGMNKSSSTNRIDMAGNVSAAVVDNGDGNNNTRNEDRQARLRARSEEEQKAKLKARGEGQRDSRRVVIGAQKSKRAPRRSKDEQDAKRRSDASHLEARREQHRRRADEERQTKSAAKGSSSRSSKLSRIDEDRDMELEKRRDKNRRRTEEERKAKKAASNRSFRPGAQSASSNDPKSDRARRKQGRNQNSGRSIDDRDDYDAIASHSLSNDEAAVVASTVVEEDDSRLDERLRKRDEEHNKQIQMLLERDNQRQKELEDAALQREQENLERMEAEKKKRNRNICIGIILLVLVGAGVGCFFAFGKSGSEPGPSSAPTPVSDYSFAPPNEATCEAIASKEETFFDNLSGKQNIKIGIEVNLEDGFDIQDLLDFSPDIEAALQKHLMPLLAGCGIEDATRHLDQLALRGYQRQATALKYLILFGSVQGPIELEECPNSNEESCRILVSTLSVFPKTDVECDALVDEVKSMLAGTQDFVQVLNLPSQVFSSIKIVVAEDCSDEDSNENNSPTASPVVVESPVTGIPTSSPSDRPTRAPVVGTFPPTKATPSPTNVPTKSPTPGPTCVAIESLFEDVLEVEPEDNKDELSYSLECPKDFLDLVVLSKTNEGDGCEITCLGHAPIEVSEGACENNEEYSVILQVGDWNPDDLTMVIGYVNENLLDGMECPEESLVLVTGAPTKAPTPSPTDSPTAEPTPSPTSGLLWPSSALDVPIHLADANVVNPTPYYFYASPNAKFAGMRFYNRDFAETMVTVRHIEDDIVTIEVWPGLFVGYGTPVGFTFNSGIVGFQAELVSEASNKRRLRVIPAKREDCYEPNGLHVSFELEDDPGKVLHHTNGNVFFTNMSDLYPNNCVYHTDASWRPVYS